jgi:hypothetical protein
MKYLINKKFIGAAALLLLILNFSCKKYEEKALQDKPKAAFTVTPITGMVNKYLLSSSSTNAFRHDWNKDGAGYKQGMQIDTVYFPDKGTYTVKLFVFGQSGIDSASQVVTVAIDDPAAITPFKLLTGNNTKTWKLAQEVNAMMIGPADFSGVWWGNNITTDLTARACHFNDEYTFVKAGNVLQFNGKNDFYVDEEAGSPHPAGMPAVGCYAASAIPAAFRPWADNANFTFEVINNNKLKLNGLGAHLGVYKAANPPDAAVATPQSTVTYDIVSITATRLVVKIDYGWGAWKFTYVAM